MVVAAFVAPYLLEATARFALSAARVPPADADDRVVSVPMQGMSMVTTSPSRRLNDSSGTMLLPVSSTAPTGKVSAT